MKTTMYNVGMAILVGVFAMLFLTVDAAPMESGDGEPSENSLIAYADGDVDMVTPWDSINTAALRKLLSDLEAKDRMGRVSRSWPQAEPRGWGLRNMDGRLARPWRADKRQVRFRQCYFNPISCFRK